MKVDGEIAKKNASKNFAWVPRTLFLRVEELPDGLVKNEKEYCVLVH
jgi:hypothetical protein